MNKIKELRTKLNLSLSEFGARINKGKSTIYRWETEQRMIKPKDAKVIADEFNVSMSWLMGYEAPPQPELNKEQLSLLAMFSLLTEEEQSEVIKYISNIIMRRNKE